MLDHLAITCYSAAGYRLYGKRMAESFTRYVRMPLAAFSEDRNTAPYDLWTEPGYLDFMESCPPIQEQPSYWERWDQNGRRFAHKVYAVTNQQTPWCRWRIWIDADVEFHAPLDDVMLHKLCPEGACLSFLGRKGYAWSECGFVAYRTEDPRVRSLLKDMRAVYQSGELFTLPRDRWHDSAVFDLCRQRSEIPESEQHNLSAGVAGREVWEHTLLQSFASHRKGPKRKMKHYGGVCE